MLPLFSMTIAGVVGGLKSWSGNCNSKQGANPPAPTFNAICSLTPPGGRPVGLSGLVFEGVDFESPTESAVGRIVGCAGGSVMGSGVDVGASAASGAAVGR